MERAKGVLTGPLVRFLFGWYKNNNNDNNNNEHILLITMLTIKSLSTIDSLKKKLFRQDNIYNSFRLNNNNNNNNNNKSDFLSPVV